MNPPLGVEKNREAPPSTFTRTLLCAAIAAACGLTAAPAATQGAQHGARARCEKILASFPDEPVNQARAEAISFLLSNPIFASGA